jgi:hypothetical protein
MDDIDWTKLIRNYHRKTLQIPDDRKRARIVYDVAGPVDHLQLRHLPSDWVLYSMIGGPEPIAEIARLREEAERDGYVGEDEVAFEDSNPVNRKMMRL